MTRGNTNVDMEHTALDDERENNVDKEHTPLDDEREYKC
jgi:hypothetical protein